MAIPLRWLLWCLLVSLWAALPTRAGAAPRCTLRGSPWIEGRIATAPLTPAQAPLTPATAGATARLVEARRGQTIAAFLMVPGLLDGRPVVFSEDGARGHVSFAAAGCGRLRVAWRRVEPRPEHRATRAPNQGIAVYANAQVFGPHHGRWIGFDRIEYFETPWPEVGDGPSVLLREARPSTAPAAARLPGHEGLGTLRLAATVLVEPAVASAAPGPPSEGPQAKGAPSELRTPGAGDAPAGLISDGVFRFSFRQGDGFLGWLTSFYNVPYLFGSAGEGPRSQAERYLGADCADVLTAALRRAGRRDLRYTNVGGLIDALGAIGTVVEIPTPAGAAVLRMAGPGGGDSVALRPGDLLAVDYVQSAELPRAWDHIVVLIEDRGPGGAPDGVLGPQDLVADSGDGLGLKISPLGDQGRVRVRAARPRGVAIGPTS